MSIPKESRWKTTRKPLEGDTTKDESFLKLPSIFDGKKGTKGVGFGYG
jgi:hypothetical protein